MNNCTKALMGLVALGIAGVANATLPERPWLIRGRIQNTQPNDTSSFFTTSPLNGMGASVSTDWSGEFDLSFFPHRNLAVELSLGLTQPNFSATANGKSVGRLCDATSLPASVTAQWHPFANKVVRPYLGFGLNYTGYFNEDASDALDLTLGGPTRVDMDDSFGVTAQAGLDVVFCTNWVVNVDVRYTDSDTTITTTSDFMKDQVDLEVNPWTFSTGVGYRF